MAKASGSSADPQERVYAHQMVRTDSKAQKLDAFLQPSTSTTAAQSRSEKTSSPPKHAEDVIELDDSEMLDAVEVLEPSITDEPNTDTQHPPEDAPPR